MSFSLFGESLEVGYSLYTYHWSSYNADLFRNEVSDDGRLINNKLFALTYRGKDRDGQVRGFSIFAGEDSIGSIMIGGSRNFLLGGDINETGFIFNGIVGAYYFDQTAWTARFKDRDIDTPSYLTYLTGIPINIVLGFQLNYQIKLGDTVFIKLTNTITPLITNHAVSIGNSF